METERRMAKKRSHNSDKTAQQQIKENNAKKIPRNELNKGSSGVGSTEIAEKMARVANSGSIDPNSSDHVVAMTQLKETIASLQKKLTLKDKDLLQKDKAVKKIFIQTQKSPLLFPFQYYSFRIKDDKLHHYLLQNSL